MSACNFALGGAVQLDGNSLSISTSIEEVCRKTLQVGKLRAPAMGKKLRFARTIWIVDAHGYGKRFIVRADELLTAFVELESAGRQSRKIWVLR